MNHVPGKEETGNFSFVTLKLQNRKVRSCVSMTFCNTPTRSVLQSKPISLVLSSARTDGLDELELADQHLFCVGSDNATSAVKYLMPHSRKQGNLWFHCNLHNLCYTKYAIFTRISTVSCWVVVWPLQCSVSFFPQWLNTRIRSAIPIPGNAMQVLRQKQNELYGFRVPHTQFCLC